MIGIPVKRTPPGVLDLGVLLRRIPRPERSGWLSVIAWSLFVAFAVVPVGGEGKPSLMCTLVPWVCPTQPSAEHDDKPSEERHVEWVTFYPGVRGKQHICTCHADLRYRGKPVQHFHFTMEQTCDSAPVPREWTRPSDSPFCTVGPCNVVVESADAVRWKLEDEDGEYRWHCTDKDDDDD